MATGAVLKTAVPHKGLEGSTPLSSRHYIMQEKQISILRKLAAGCALHPAYRYIRKPKNCSYCLHLYDLKLILMELDKLFAPVSPLPSKQKKG